MGTTVFRIILLIGTLATFSLGFPQPSKSSKGTIVKYRKQQETYPPEDGTPYEKKDALFPVKSKILCPDPGKCKENLENGVRVKKQLNFFDEDDELVEDLSLEDEEEEEDGNADEGEPSEYEDLDAEESAVGASGRRQLGSDANRWKRSLLGRIFGYPSGHYRRRWWPARRRHHHHHRHRHF